MDTGQARGLFDLRRAGRGLAIGDVVIDGIVEQHGVLGNDANGLAQAVLADLADILAVNFDRAAGDVVKAEQQAREGRFTGPRRPDDGHRAAGRHLEGDVFEDWPVGPVMKADVAKDDPPAGHFEGRRRRRVDNLQRLVDQAEHGLHVGQRLFDFAVYEAQEVERQVKLDQVSVDHHEIADGHDPGAHVDGRHDHDDGQANGDNRRLADVQQRERRLVFDRRRFVASQRVVETRRFMTLVAEILHRFEIQQAVDGLGVGGLVRTVHFTSEFQSPFGDQHGVGDVGADCRQGDQRVPDVKQRPQNHRHQNDLDDRRHDVKQHEGQNELDALDAAFNDP